MRFTIDDLKEKYDIKLDEIIENIQEKNPKSVLLQFPEGLKPYATAVVDYIEEQIGKEIDVRIWLGSCFGACDVPNTKADLIIQFGHAPWGKKEFNELE